MPHLSITDLAAALVERTHAQAKTAAAVDDIKPVSAPVLGAHPITSALKLAAEALRAFTPPAPTLEDLQKVAAGPGQPSTGAQAPAAGNGTGTAGAPSLPALLPTNAGVTAGGGGMPVQPKVASAMGDAVRELAAGLRAKHASIEVEKMGKAASLFCNLVAMERMKLPTAAVKIAAFGVPAPSFAELGAAAKGVGPALEDAARMGIPGAMVGGLKGGLQAPEGEGLEGALRGAAVGGLAGSALGHIGGHLNPDFRIPASALGGALV